MVTLKMHDAKANVAAEGLDTFSTKATCVKINKDSKRVPFLHPKYHNNPSKLSQFCPAFQSRGTEKCCRPR